MSHFVRGLFLSSFRTEPLDFWGSDRGQPCIDCKVLIFRKTSCRSRLGARSWPIKHLCLRSHDLINCKTNMAAPFQTCKCFCSTLEFAEVPLEVIDSLKMRLSPICCVSRDAFRGIGTRVRQDRSRNDQAVSGHLSTVGGCS